jgi:hypothetical protein
MKQFYTKVLLVSAVSLASAANVYAAVPWVGSANYLAAPNAQNDEALVGPFDSYDFGAGIGLIKPDGQMAVGQTFSGWFQTWVGSHVLNGSGITVPQLNTSGSGTGFELTVVSQFTGTYTSLVSGGMGFTIDSGLASMMFDSNPNYHFGLDQGFSDGNAIFTGSITGGSGFVNTAIGYGFEAVSLDMTGSFGLVDANVYSPGNINGANALFSIAAKTPFVNTPVINQVLAGNKTVQGNSVINGQLFELDGNLQLTAVPLPATAWMFLGGLFGLVGINRKKGI